MACDVIEYGDLGRFHERYYAANRPVVIRGLREAGPLEIFDWSVDFLAKRLAGRPVPVLTTDTGFLSYERDSNPLPFNEFVARSFGETRDRARRYYFKNPTKVVPELHDDSDRLEALAEYTRRSVVRNLWISGDGLTVGLHFDAAENINIQLRGRKNFMLFPPGVRGYYPLPMFSQTAHISGVFRDGPRPDLARFPKFDPSRAVHVELREGEALYLPAYWWHQVESLGDENVNLNFWWFPPVRKQLRHWNQALRGHAQLALRLLKFGNVQQAPRATRL